jgi:EmrB/QacA subfamily drug resistance transporter
MTQSTTNRNEATVSIDYAATLTGMNKVVILIGVLLGLFLAALDQTIVATALPSIVADLQGLDLLAWITTSYLLVSTTTVPIYGKISDIYGRKIILMIGIVIFMIGSALCGVASSMLMLSIFRGIQGLGAAAITSSAFAVVADLFSPVERARYQSMFQSVFVLASVVGPLLGGMLTDTIGWRWVFYINVPIGIVALLVIGTSMPKLHSGLRSPIDFMGVLLLVTTVTPLLLGLTLDKTTYPWDSPLILGLFGFAAVSLVFFIIAERRAAGPIIPIELFNNRAVALINLMSVPVGVTIITAILFLSIFLVNVLDVSATTAGTTLVPLMGGVIVGSMISSAIVSRIGHYKIVVLAGLAIIAAAFWWLSTMTITTTMNEARLRMVVLGLGIGPVPPLLTLALQSSVAKEYIGAVTASRQFFQQLGQVLGSAVFGALLTAMVTSSITTNMQPLRQQLPPELAAQFDPSQLRNGGGEGGGGGAGLSEERIQTGIKNIYGQIRTDVDNALTSNNTAAIQALSTNPDMPEQVRTILQAPDQTNEQKQAKADAAIDELAAAAEKRSPQITQALTQAVKQSFTTGVTSVYAYASPLVILAFIIMLFVPEVPLRGKEDEGGAEAVLVGE